MRLGKNILVSEICVLVTPQCRTIFTSSTVLLLTDLKDDRLRGMILKMLKMAKGNK